MEHIVPESEYDEHVEEECSCKPRIIYDSKTGELVAIHQAFRDDLEMITDKLALKLLHTK